MTKTETEFNSTELRCENLERGDETLSQLLNQLGETLSDKWNTITSVPELPLGAVG